MGLKIPDNDFACVNVLRELDRGKENLDSKKNIGDSNTDIEDDILVTNGLGKSVPANLTWLDQDETVFEQKASGKLKNRRHKKKSAVKLSRPVTRSQKKKKPVVYEACNPTLPPGRVTRSKFHKKRSK